MPIIEMQEPDSMISGVLTPNADQKKFVSTWAVKAASRNGTVTGFKAQNDLSQPQPFGHGSSRAISGYEPYLDGKKKEHVVSMNGVELIEMICDRESVEARDRWCGAVSRGIVDGRKNEEIERQERAGLKVTREEDTIIHPVTAE